MSDRILVRKVEQNLWQWRAVSVQGEWQSEAFYTGDVNLLKESVQGHHVWLILPGQNVVSQRVEASTKDRRQLLKLLPYEIEEGVLTAVEDLHFAFGEIKDDTIDLAYADIDWLKKSIVELESIGAMVQRCGVDYLQMMRPDDGWTVLLENRIVYAHHDEGVGFAIEQEMAGAYLAALIQSEAPAVVRLCSDHDEGFAELKALLPEGFAEVEGRIVEESLAGFWDLVSPSAVLYGDFRTGRLARRLPFDKWWQEFKYPIIAMAASFLIALGCTWIELKRVDADRKAILAQTDQIFRQAVPSGNINDPERQLRGLLGGSGTAIGKSNVVKLVSGIAPVIHGFGELTIRNLRYSVENRELQLNIEAKSFDTFEALRAKIAEAGYSVDIKSANANGEIHQAQIRVSEAG